MATSRVHCSGSRRSGPARRHRGEYASDARGWLRDVALIPLEDALLDEATSLDPPALRSLDALHLATALSIRDDLGAFYSYDGDWLRPPTATAWK